MRQARRVAPVEESAVNGRPPFPARRGARVTRRDVALALRARRPRAPSVRSRSAPRGRGRSALGAAGAVHPVQFPQRGAELASARGTYRVAGGHRRAASSARCTSASGPFDQVYAVKMMRPANRPYAEVQAEWVQGGAAAPVPAAPERRLHPRRVRAGVPLLSSRSSAATTRCRRCSARRCRRASSSSSAGSSWPPCSSSTTTSRPRRPPPGQRAHHARRRPARA